MSKGKVSGHSHRGRQENFLKRFKREKGEKRRFYIYEEAYPSKKERTKKGKKNLNNKEEILSSLFRGKKNNTTGGEGGKGG